MSCNKQAEKGTPPPVHHAVIVGAESGHPPPSSPPRKSYGTPAKAIDLQARQADKIIVEPSKNVRHQMFHNVDLMLGRQDPSCAYFTRRYFSLPDLSDTVNESGLNTRALNVIPELDPHAFNIYKGYTDTGVIEFDCTKGIEEKYSWAACWPIMNAFTFGCIIEDSDFTDRIMDILVDRLTPGVGPDIETVEHIFDKNRTISPAQLKQLAIDRFLDAHQSSSEAIESSRYPISFQLLALPAALSRLSHGGLSRTQSGYEYRSQRATEACYETTRKPVTIAKKLQLAKARETSARDAETVLANVKQNGVNAIDWAQRGTEKQNLPVETAKPWLSFRRLDDEVAANCVVALDTSREKSNAWRPGAHLDFNFDS